MDVIKINVPTFVRILELAREEIKNDPDLHDIAEIAARLSDEGVITMNDYDSIVHFMKRQGNDESDQELEDIRRLGGIS
jgi:hypothetical protein